MKIITKSDVCKILGKKHSEVTSLIKKNNIPFHKVGYNKYLFFEEDVIYYMKTGIIRNSGLNHKLNDEILITIAKTIKRSDYLDYIRHIKNKKTFIVIVSEICLTFLLSKNLRLIKKGRKFILSGNQSNGKLLNAGNIEMFIFSIIKELNLYNENRKTYYASVNEVYRQLRCMVI